MKLLFSLILLTSSWSIVSSAQEAARTAGRSVFGENRYIEYIPGNLPLVIASPHGGRERPESMPNRVNGVTTADMNTQELARAVSTEIHRRTARSPHLIICRLHRVKLDPNREIQEAAQGHAIAEKAWHEHHAFISEACQKAVTEFGQAFLIDLHGHSHPVARLELGYLHSVDDLKSPTAVLDAPLTAARGSLAALAKRSGLSYSELLRGPDSLGAYLEKQGFLATPSPSLPIPAEPFFKGGYTTETHCLAEKKTIGLQIEAPRPRLRDTAENRKVFAVGLSEALDLFFKRHLGFGLDGKNHP